MADTYASIFQSNPAATTVTDALTVAASTAYLLRGVNVCNFDAGASTVRIMHAPAGAADAAAHRLVYEYSIPTNTTVYFPFFIGLAATDKIRVRASTANVTFIGSGIKIT